MIENQKPQYHPVKDCSYWTVLGSFKKCNIVQFSHKATYSEEIEKVNQVVPCVISYNMDALVQTGQYDGINTIYTTKMVYYVIKFLSEAYTL